ncbi:YqeG family HAD IIIA-type phosphatase [Lentilactobacillus senioris]|uniref:HAD superfamily hydrolase n=1 Tax=Lentilactobacillus senioris DSM 24302 = JCM 17472 TaxID=1423802 RepID=A0A0R2D0J3_9LACO|nr:YqeG family HAD IIIA-type phosphatase [Lentilactobacillus senioris]KRM93945.1 HAD superfamily hydrolase [Lentilactobacillus senioris DSM 24302 = JCM 17472]
MLEQFKPTWMFESIFEVTPAFLKQNQLTTIFTDLDNTLMPWDKSLGDPRLRPWLKQMKDSGISVIVVSNNSKKRIAKAIEPLGLKFVSRALKPTGIGINRAIKKWHLNRSEVVMIGDQVLTDVRAANRCGIDCILVKPLVPNDAWNTTINRNLERIVWKKVQAKYPEMHW